MLWRSCMHVPRTSIGTSTTTLVCSACPAYTRFLRQIHVEIAGSLIEVVGAAVTSSAYNYVGRYMRLKRHSFEFWWLNHQAHSHY